MAAAAGIDAVAAPWRTLIRHARWVASGGGGVTLGSATTSGDVKDDDDAGDAGDVGGNADVADETPTVSVVLVTYNRPRLLRQALASLMRQDHPMDRLEVVLVDDGSELPEAKRLLDELEARERGVGGLGVRRMVVNVFFSFFIP